MSRIKRYAEEIWGEDWTQKLEDIEMKEAKNGKRK